MKRLKNYFSAIVLMFFSINAYAQVCEKHINEFRAGFEKARGFCANEDKTNHDYVQHGVNNEITYRYTNYRPGSDGISSRPVQLQYENIGVCRTSSDSCKSICEEAHKKISDCLVGLNVSNLLASSSLGGSVQMLDANIASSRRTIACLNEAVLSCNAATGTAERSCMLGEEGVIRGNSSCSAAVGDLQLALRDKNCESSDTNEVAAFNTSKQQMLQELATFSTNSRQNGTERSTQLSSGMQECKSKSESAHQTKERHIDELTNVVNSMVRARLQLQSN